MKEETIYQYKDQTVIKKKIQRPEETSVGVDNIELWREKSRCAINLQHSIRSKWGRCLTLQVSEPKLGVVSRSRGQQKCAALHSLVSWLSLVLPPSFSGLCGILSSVLVCLLCKFVVPCSSYQERNLRKQIRREVGEAESFLSHCGARAILRTWT